MGKLKVNYHFWWKVLPFVGVVVWGALCITNNLWYDEAYSASMVSLPWKRLVYITAVDDHSPFYYFILKLFYHLFGGGPRLWSLKLLSLLFMTGYLLLGKFYVKKLFGEKMSVFFMLFSITMPIMAVQAGNVRMYAAALFFLTLTGLSAADIMRESSAGKWMVFCLAGLCTVYCHTFAMFQTLFIYLLFFGTIIYKKEYKKLKGFFASGCVVAVVYFPWMLVTLHQMQLRMSNDPGVKPTLYTFMDYCKEWFSAMETPIALVVFTGMALAIFLGYYAVDWMRHNRNYVPGLGVAAIGLTALTGTLISVFINPCFLGRYAFPGFGALALLYAAGMCQITSRRIKAGVLAAVMMCFVLQYSSELKLEYDPGLKTYKEFVEQNVTEEDCIIASGTHTVFLNVYYPDLQYFIYGYKLYSLPFVNTDAFTQWEQLENREGNIWYICFKGDEPSQMAERYDYEETLSFHYMYYDFVIYRLAHK